MKNWYGTWAFFKRESHRFIKVWPQTIGAPLISTFLYFAIFGGVLGSQIGVLDGVSYLAFLVPGLTAMTMLQQSFQNTSSSLIISKFQGLVQSDLLALPLTSFQIVLAYMCGSILRGALVGIAILILSRFFVEFSIAHPLLFLFSLISITGISGLLGLLVGLWADDFDKTSIVGNFVLTPLVYLGGVFFSISLLSDFWAFLARWNPLFYLIDLFRFTILDTSQGIPLLSLFSILCLWIFSFFGLVRLVQKGWKIKK